MIKEVLDAIYQRYTGAYTPCVRAFNFNGDCADSMGVDDGVGTAITYATGKFGILQSALFNGTTSLVNIGSAADIDNLADFSIVAFIYPAGGGEADLGVIYSKSGIIFRVREEAAGFVKLEGEVDCAVTAANSKSTATIPIMQWSAVMMTWSDATKTVRLYHNETEVIYENQTIGVAAQMADAASDGIIGNLAAVTNTFAGAIDTFRLYNAMLPISKMGWFLETPIYLVETSRTQELSYVTINPIDVYPDYLWPGIERHIWRVQFSVYSNGDDAHSGAEIVGIVLDAINRCFNAKRVSITGYTNCGIRREITIPPFKPDAEVWQGTADYTVEVQ
jgi:hypothetical protein